MKNSWGNGHAICDMYTTIKNYSNFIKNSMEIKTDGFEGRKIESFVQFFPFREKDIFSILNA